MADYTSADLTHLGSTSDDAIVHTISSRWKHKLPYTRINATSLVAVNPHESLADLDDSHAELYADACYRDISGKTGGIGEGEGSADNKNEPHTHQRRSSQQLNSWKGGKSLKASHQRYGSSTSIYSAPSLPPHPFELAGKVYYHLRRTGQDQTVIFCGMTGSGKTTSASHVLAQLCRLGTHTKREARIALQLQQAQRIVDAFGCSYTKANRNASLYSKFLEVQFSERGRILGGKTLCYLLDHSRVAKFPSDERGFHVFYYLLHSSPEAFSEQDKMYLRLNDSFAYMNNMRFCHGVTAAGGDGTAQALAIEDSMAFDALKESMKACGFRPRQMLHIWRLLAVILQLGNLQFVDPVSACKQLTVQEAATVKNIELLDLIADVLGVPGDKLLTALTYKSKLIRRDLCTVVLNAQGASAHRDSLAKALYAALFGYIVEHINSKLCHAEPANFVALLDQAGFSEPSPNISGTPRMAQFKHFATNFADEILHGFLARRMLTDQIGYHQLMAQDGVQLPPLSLTSGSSNFDGALLQLLLGKQYRDDVPLPAATTGSSSKGHSKTFGSTKHTSWSSTNPMIGGLIRIIDDSSLQYGQGSSTDADCLHKATVQFRDNALFIANKASSNFFAIKHHYNRVDYSIDDFLDRNLDQISPDFVVLLQNSANKFIIELFSNESSGLSVESHPKFERTIVKAQLQTKPKRQPSRIGGPGPNASRRKSMVIRNMDSNLTLKAAVSASATTGTDGNNRSNGEKQQLLRQNTTSKREDEPVSTVLSQIVGTLQELMQTMDETMLWHMFCLSPNDSQAPSGAVASDTKRLRMQVNALMLPEIAHCKRGGGDFVVHYTFAEFLSRYERQVSRLLPNVDRSTMSDKSLCLEFVMAQKWSHTTTVPRPCTLGNAYVWLSFDAWKEIEDELRALEKEERAHQKAIAEAEAREEAARASAAAAAAEAAVPTTANDIGGNISGDVRQGSAFPGVEKFWSGRNYAPSEAGGIDDDFMSEMGEKDDDMMSEYGYNPSGAPGGRRMSSLPIPGALTMVGGGTGRSGEGNIGALGGGKDPKGGQLKGMAEKRRDNAVEEPPMSASRKLWVFFTWCMTWWIPSFCLSRCGKMKRKDVQMAWREKVALCCIIFFMSFIIIFVITGFGKLMCPGAENLFSPTEVSYHASPDDFYVSLRGRVYDITRFAKNDHSNGHASYPSDAAYMLPFAGTDVTEYFPVPLNIGCYGLVTNPGLALVANNTIVGSQVHGPPTSDTTIGWYSSNNQGQWYWQVALKRLLPMKKGDLAIEMADIQADIVRKWFVIDGKVYDLTSYYNTIKAPGNVGPQGAGVPSVHFLDQAVEDMAFNHNGEDVTELWNKLPINPQLRMLTRSCLDQVFYIGKVDYRKSFQCQFTNYMLLVTSCILVSVIGIKFLAALQLGSIRIPEEHDRFVIVQIPCYTEDEDSLRKTIDSITVLRYDDKRKLLFIVADGMIIGSGNELPTPRIVLNILGADPGLDPEPLAFKSIGDGMKQLNMGKVYSGLYEKDGHVVPYIVVAKVGTPSERTRPGNRGKRDSQVILMKFLNKVHFDAPMCPLELEIYHQMKNVIGVNPSFYEYILQVDADTEVMPDALNRLVSCMIHDGKIIGICGETQLGNEENSWTTMIQVYEYYISHHLAKAFESLFGSVTCLPGCFCMYRIRTVVKSIPLIISGKVIEEYSDNQVDTLHKKNLLSLGEDRYLTTLMMKHFPQYKMKFTPDAICKTVAPDRWSVLLSQRRRWINSTIHNLAELMFLPEMCGFCCFSMRFVVFLDLFGTLTLPASVIYLVYLIIIVATGMETLPKISLILLGAVYGLQAFIFIIKRQWQHIGWMFIYILAIPLFSFFIPLYSFWHFDDFSWGNTRMVVGETGKSKKGVMMGDDEEIFDDRMIPMKKWSVYEQEMWEMGSIHSHESKGTAVSYHSKAGAGHDSMGGGFGGGPDDGTGGGGMYAGSIFGSQLNLTTIPGSPRSTRGADAATFNNPYGQVHPFGSISQDEMHQRDYYRDTNIIQQQQQQQQQGFGYLNHHRMSRSSLNLPHEDILNMRRSSVTSLSHSVIGVNSPATAAAAAAAAAAASSPYNYMHRDNGSMDFDRRSIGGTGGVMGSPYLGAITTTTTTATINPYMVHQIPPATSVIGSPFMLPAALPALPQGHLRTGSNASGFFAPVVTAGPTGAMMSPHMHAHHGSVSSLSFSQALPPPAVSAYVTTPIPAAAPTQLVMDNANTTTAHMVSDQPTNDQIVAEIQNVLATADLMSITKKQVRERLMNHFGCDLTSRKDFINEVIDQVLNSLSS
ncbi:hypothetical protein BGW41_007302 [Actinomortierella wolfii]|nr:hypothetical protein BGW41_007302 [Actinomortierella wolfii]